MRHVSIRCFVIRCITIVLLALLFYFPLIDAVSIEDKVVRYGLSDECYRDYNSMLECRREKDFNKTAKIDTVKEIQIKQIDDSVKQFSSSVPFITHKLIRYDISFKNISENYILAGTSTSYLIDTLSLDCPDVSREDLNDLKREYQKDYFVIERVNLSNIVERVENVKRSVLSKCYPMPYSEMIGTRNGTFYVTNIMKFQWEVRFSISVLTKLLLLIVSIIIVGVLLPIGKQLWLFIMKGKSFFRE